MYSAKTTQKVLMVDRDSEWRELLQFALEDRHRKIYGVGGISRAWHWLRANSCDAMIVGTVTPLDGICFIRAVNYNYPALPTILISSDIESDVKRAKTLPFCYLVFKPLNVELLRLALCRALNSKVERSEMRSRFRVFGDKIRYVWRLGKRFLSDFYRLRLEASRDKCCQQYLEAIRSGSLSLGGALWAWYRLEGLESQSLPSTRAEFLDLVGRYVQFRKFVEGLSYSSRIFWPQPPSQYSLNRRLFSQLFDKISRNELSLKELKELLTFYRDRDSAPSVERYISDLCGEDSKNNSAFAQARRSLEEGTGVWELIK